MAIHSSVLAWRIPQGYLPSVGRKEPETAERLTFFTFVWFHLLHLNFCSIWCLSWWMVGSMRYAYFLIGQLALGDVRGRGWRWGNKRPFLWSRPLGGAPLDSFLPDWRRKCCKSLEQEGSDWLGFIGQEEASTGTFPSIHTTLTSIGSSVLLSSC